MAPFRRSALVVVAIGFALGLCVLFYGSGWFVGAFIIVAVGVLLVAPK
jgi:hypothetical protein